MRFVIFERGEQKQFIELAKKNSNKSWSELAKYIKKGRSTLLAYYDEQYDLPEDVYQVLLLYFSESPFVVQYKHKRYTRCILSKRPQLTNMLAEFIGIAMGDGYIDNDPYEFVISTHTYLDRTYRDKIKKYFKLLFDQEFSERTQGNKHYLRFYSKEFTQWLHINYGFPYGKKKDRLHIPPSIRADSQFVIAFLRGVYDTDGTICPHHKSSGAIVEFSSASTAFREELATELDLLGFKVCRGRKAIMIYRKVEILRFFGLIKPQNNKHIVKYEMFKSTGQVPLTKTLAPVV